MLTRIDESAQSHLRNCPWSVRGNFTVEMRNAAEWQIVGLNLVVQGEFGELRHQAPMSPHDALEQAFVRQTIESAVLAIPWRGGKHQREGGWVALLDEAPLKRKDQLVRRSDADEARNAHRIVVADNGDCFVGGNNLVLERHPPSSSRTATWRSRGRAKPATCRRRRRRRVRPATAARCSPSCPPLCPKPERWRGE